MKTVAVIIKVVFVLFAGLCFAAVPPVMNYHGKLTDTGGALVADGSYDMVFSIYNAVTGGTELWSETWDSGSTPVAVTNGIFNVLHARNAPRDCLSVCLSWACISLESDLKTAIYASLKLKRYLDP